MEKRNDIPARYATAEEIEAQREYTRKQTKIEKSDVEKQAKKLNELKEQNLKAFYGEYFENTFYSLDDSTKQYLFGLQETYYEDITNIENKIRNKSFKVDKVHNVKKRENYETLQEIFKEIQSSR